MRASTPNRDVEVSPRRGTQRTHPVHRGAAGGRGASAARGLHRKVSTTVVSNRIKADARAYMARNPGTSYQAALRAVTADPAREEVARNPRIPTFLEALGIGDIAIHDFPAAWRETARTDEIRVPFGYLREGDVVLPELSYLNFTDVDHSGNGPHGGVAGQTGAGKSYLLRGLALSLAAVYPPDNVSLVLADVKGDVTFRGLDQFPHVAMNLPNLQSNANNREQFVSRIRDELQRRQQLLHETASENIQAHRANFRNDDRESSPLTHMFILVDELGRAGERHFAEILELLTNVGCMGRTLGMHLVVSAQRISGPEIGQLVDNLSIRVALRAASEVISRELIGSGAAAHLTPGVALRLGSSDSAPAGVQLLTFTDPLDATNTADSSPVTQGDALIERLSALTEMRVLDMGVTPARAEELARRELDVKVGKARDAIDAIVGQDPAKRQMRNIITAGTIDAERARRGLGLARSASTPPHLVLSGGPGTGKTHAVHALAHALHAAGTIAEPTVLSVGRSDLVGTAEGDTARKTRAACDDARGGVLHIVSFPELVQDRHGFSDTFGQEAVDALIGRMRQGDVTVIAEGYDEPLRRMLERNPGLAGMFSWRIEFGPFTGGELWRIMVDGAADGQVIAPDAEKLFTQMVDSIGQDGIDALGNARFALNVRSEARRALVTRLASTDIGTLSNEELITIGAADVREALAAVLRTASLRMPSALLPPPNIAK